MFWPDFACAWMRWTPDGGEFAPGVLWTEDLHDVVTVMAKSKDPSLRYARKAPSTQQIEEIGSIGIARLRGLHEEMQTCLRSLMSHVRARCRAAGRDADAELFSRGHRWLHNDLVVFEVPAYWATVAAIHAFLDAVDAVRSEVAR